MHMWHTHTHKHTHVFLALGSLGFPSKHYIKPDRVDKYL